MFRIENWRVYDLEECVVSCRNAMRIDDVGNYSADEFEKSLPIAIKLARLGGGTGHSNFRKGIRVSFDIRYPNYFSPELQRYGFVDIVCSTSKMHRLLKMDMDKCFNEYVSEDSKNQMRDLIGQYNQIAESGDVYADEEKHDAFMRVLSNCPLGIELYMRVSTNYEQLATIYKQRKNHRLKEWGLFCKFIENLPYANELIICNIEK